MRKEELSLPGQPQRGQNPGWVAAAGLPDSQFIFMSASASFSAAPAAWLDNTALLPTASVKGMRVAVFAQVRAVVYLLCHSLSRLVAGFLSQLFQCALTQPCAICARHNQACLPLGSQLSCHTAFAGLVFAMAHHGAFFSCTDRGCPQLRVLRDSFQLRTERRTPDISLLLLSKRI